MRWILAGLIFVLGLALSLYMAETLDRLLTRQDLFGFTLLDTITGVGEKKQGLLFLCLQLLMTTFALLVGVFNHKPYQSETVTVAGSIKIPKPMGQGQHGTAWWMTEKEMEQAFTTYKLPELGKLPQFTYGGITLGKKDTPDGEDIYVITDDAHTLCLGATRSGKGRTLVLPSIGCLALGGESMVLSDPKGELHQFTAPFLRSLGYAVYALDFKNPEKSNRYNYLQPIIDAVDNDMLPYAIENTFKLVNVLVPEPKNGEPLWTNGEKSVLAAAIMAVVFDNKHGDNKRFQNLTNVRAFIAEMCKEENNKTKITEYMKDKPETHPARMLFQGTEMAQGRTRASFYTSALINLQLFTNPYIYNMTKETEVTPDELAGKKCAIFFILPDEDDTYYRLASLLVSQLYEQLVKIADNHGGRLKQRVNFLLDEFGNFAKIPAFDAKLTVGGGRGIRFTLILQSFAQLDDKYGKEVSSIIRGNCATWVYLKSKDLQTNKDISETLGKYTTSSYQLSASHQRYTNPSGSHSVSLMARDLLTHDEIAKIERPYTLVTGGGKPAIYTAPDLAKWRFNELFGLGGKEYNKAVFTERHNARPERPATFTDNDLWGVWKLYGDMCVGEQ